MWERQKKAPNTFSQMRKLKTLLRAKKGFTGK